MCRFTFTICLRNQHLSIIFSKAILFGFFFSGIFFSIDVMPSMIYNLKLGYFNIRYFIPVKKLV